MRAGALSDSSVGEYINKNFVSAWKRVGTFTAIQKNGKTVARAGGSVAIYFCTPDLEVVNTIAGPVGKKAILAGAKWAVETYRKAKEESFGDADEFTSIIKTAHRAEAKKNRRLYGSAAGNGCDQPAPEAQVKSRSANRQDGCDTAQVQDADPEVREIQTLITRSKARVARACEELSQTTEVIQIQEAEAACTPVATSGDPGLHTYLAKKGLPQLDDVYRHVFERVLGQKVTDKPVNVRDMAAMRRRSQPPQAPVAAPQRLERVEEGAMRELKSQLKSAMEQIELLKKQIEELQSKLEQSK